MSRKMSLIIVFAVMLALNIAVGSAGASELVYAPINPSFLGGNPLNGGYLLAKAQSEDNNKDPEALSSSASSRLDDFAENLNRSILSLLSSRIVEKAFGDSELPTGTFTVGDFQVTINESLDQLDVTVVDVPNNSSTQISIPLL